MRENPENTKKAKPPTRLFLHMDILGTKNLIEQESAKTWLLMEVIEKFSSNKREHKIQYTKASDGIFDITSFEPEISSDSDHIHVSFPASNIFPLNQNTEMFVISSLVGIVAQIHRLALERGILMRGAITKGWQRHTGNNVIGKAQVDVVELEKEAKYPRVVIAADLVTSFTKYMPEPVRKDFDNVCFIDYLRHFPVILGQGAVINDTLVPALLNIRALIQEGLTSENVFNDNHVKKKWIWLAETFNECIDYCHKFESIRSEIGRIKQFNTLPKLKFI